MMRFLILSVAAFTLLPAFSTAVNPLTNPALPSVELLEPSSGETLELVRDGKLRFCIVGDFKAEAQVRGPMRDGKVLTLARWERNSRRQCARRLQECFQKTVGVTPQVYEVDDPRAEAYPLIIACGPCRYSQELGMQPDALPFEGFEVRTFKKGLVIAGMDAFMIPGVYDNFNWRCGRIKCNGTELGAIDFAERFLGIRRYAREEKGVMWDHYPQITNLTIKPCAYRDHPRQRIRTLRTPWRNGCSSDFFGGEAPSPFSLIKAHPDRLEDMFYRDRGGRLWCDAKSYGMNFLDFTNPALADILVDDFKAYYANDGKGSYWGSTWAPSGRYLWIGQCDKGLIMDNERAKRLPKAKGEFAMSEVYGHFYNYFARRCEAEFPGKTVVLMAYSNYLEAPTSIESFPDNVQILACLGTPVFARSPHFQNIWKENFSGWNRLTKKKCVPYTYDAGYAEDEVIQNAIRGYFEGEFYRVLEGYIDPELTYNCMYRGGAPYHYSTYLASRCMWNPSYDVDAGLKEYFSLMYGSAAKTLTEFYYGVLDRWINHYLPYEPTAKSRKGSIPCPHKNVFHFKTFEESAARRLLALLSRAEKEVEVGSLEEKRVKWFVTPFRNQLEDIIAFQQMKPIHLTVSRAASEVAIDGKIDERAWQIDSLPAFRRAYAGGDRPVISPETRILWNEKGLLVSIRSPQPYVKSDALWKGDSFEVMLAPKEKVANLYQFVLDPAGNYEDFWKQVDPPRGKEINWRAPNVQSAANASDKDWTGELFIPWSDLAPGEKPVSGDVWKINLIYNRQSPAEYISLSPTQNNNHRIDLYATIKFE